jgi:hypothetical protein
MSVKSKLIDEIEKKAARIKEMRVRAASNKTIEAYVFEFFRNMEEVNKMSSSSQEKYGLTLDAHRSLVDKIRTIDQFIHAEGAHINWTEDGQVQGLTIRWSASYIKQNSCEPEFYIDIGQMLFS